MQNKEIIHKEFCEALNSDSTPKLNRVLDDTRYTLELSHDPAWIYLALTKAVSLGNVKSVRNIFTYIEDHDYSLNEAEIIDLLKIRLSEKLFKAACYSNNIDVLNFVDDKLNVIKPILEKDFELPMEVFSNKVTYDEDAHINYSESLSYTTMLQSFWLRDGLLTAAKLGNEKIIDHIFSNYSITDNLRDSAFIYALKTEQLNTAKIVCNYFGKDEIAEKFNNSVPIQRFIKHIASDEKRALIKIMILETELDAKNSVKKTNFKI